MNPCLAPFLIAAFFGGVVLGARLAAWPYRRLLADEPVLT